MSRDEARRLLQGTFTFKLDGGQVVINDDSLIREIHDLMASSPEFHQSSEWSAPDTVARRTGYSALA